MATITKQRWILIRLRRLGACSDAVKFANKHESAQAAWDACPRGDWMLWTIGRTIKCDPWTDGRKPLLACALDCAETVKHLWRKSQADNIGAAIAVLRKWIDGTATVQQAKEARNSLYADAYADAAAYAADAAYAAYAYAADAAYAYAADAARITSQKQAADIVRRHFPKPPKVK